MMQRYYWRCSLCAKTWQSWGRLPDLLVLLHFMNEHLNDDAEYYVEILPELRLAETGEAKK